jgi:GMP synthase PP-ATPase subunit
VVSYERGIQGDLAVLEAYMKAMLAMQEQGETMLDMIQNSGVLQEGSQKMIKEWANKYKEIQKTYLDMVEDHFKKLEEIFESTP